VRRSRPTLKTVEGPAEFQAALTVLPVLRRRIIVHGLVQGVGFRYAVGRAASSRGVAGWVRNRPDGTVEAVFEGERTAVESLVRLCEEGPRGAVVDRVEMIEEEPEGSRRFDVR
jgi:acylphosphatase